MEYSKGLGRHNWKGVEQRYPWYMRLPFSYGAIACRIDVGINICRNSSNKIIVTVITCPSRRSLSRGPGRILS